MKKITLLFLLFTALSNAQNTWEQFILYPGNYASKPMFFTEYNGNVYFQARGLGIGTELYKTDGTQVGTTLISDIMTAPTYGSYPENFTVFQNQLFFTASHAVYGRELFKTDGTTVTLVKDINPGSANSTTFTEENQSAFIEYDGFLYFFANDHQSYFFDWDLWRTDGTTAGTTKVLEIGVPQVSGFKKNFKLIDGKFYFIKKLATTTLLFQFNPNTQSLIELANLNGEITHMYEFENKLFFNSSSNILYYTTGILNSLNSYINFVNTIGSRQMKVLGSNLIFIGGNLDLYKCYFNSTNSTYETSPLYSFSGTIDPFSFARVSNSANEIFVEYNNKLYFDAREATSPTNSSGGKINQIYSTDGFNTQVVVPIDNIDFPPQSGNHIRNLVVHNDAFYFTMYDYSIYYDQLWKANPTTGSYEQLSFPNSATTPKYIAAEHQSKSYNDLVWFNNSLFMGAFTTAEEKELWKFTGGSDLSISSNTLDKIKIFPNPTSGILNIQVDNLAQINVEVFDILGKKVAQFSKQSQIDISNLIPGLYFIKVLNTQTTISTTHKIIKQ